MLPSDSPEPAMTRLYFFIFFFFFKAFQCEAMDKTGNPGRERERDKEREKERGAIIATQPQQFEDFMALLKNCAADRFHKVHKI